MLPTALAPTDVLTVAHAGGIHHLPLCRPSFMPAADADEVHRFGNKDLVLVEGRPQFAEVAILRLFEADGWHGRWVETYPYRKNPRFWREWSGAGPMAQRHVPITTPWVDARLREIAAANGGPFSGCWDVAAWKGDRLVFAESKKRRKDRLRGTQLRWLEAALRCGLQVEDFLVVEWSIAPPPEEQHPS